MIKLSKPSKLNCLSFGIPNDEATCIGKRDDNGVLKPVCKGCYAGKGFYNMTNVKQALERNKELTMEDSFIHDMVESLNRMKSNYFRWFHSGDIYSNEFLTKVIAICQQTPQVKHWIPTKSRELLNQELWKTLESLPNVTVRYSSPSIMGHWEEKHGSTVNSVFLEKSTKGLFQCPAPTQENKCNKCHACWNKNIKVVQYLKH